MMMRRERAGQDDRRVHESGSVADVRLCDPLVSFFSFSRSCDRAVVPSSHHLSLFYHKSASNLSLGQGKGEQEEEEKKISYHQRV